MIQLKLTKIGNSVGVILPKEMLQEMNLSVGDSLVVTRTPDGYRMAASSEAFEQQMKVAEEIMQDWRQALRALAK